MWVDSTYSIITGIGVSRMHTTRSTPSVIRSKQSELFISLLSKAIYDFFRQLYTGQLPLRDLWTRTLYFQELHTIESSGRKALRTNTFFWRKTLHHSATVGACFQPCRFRRWPGAWDLYSWNSWFCRPNIIFASRRSAFIHMHMTYPFPSGHA